MRSLVALAFLLAIGATPGLAQSHSQPRTIAAPAEGRIQEPAPLPLPTADKSAEIDATLSYFNFINGAFRIDIGQYPDPGDSKAAGLFFVAPFDGTVDRVDFSLLNGSNDEGIKGSGTLRIKMVPSAQILSPDSPGVDSLDVNFSQLMAENGFPNTSNFVNQIDLTSKNFEVVEGMEYFFQFSLVNESSTASLSFVFDGGVSDTTLTTHFPARSFIWAELGSGDEYVTLRDPVNTDFRNLNLVTALQLSRLPPPQMTQLQVLNNAPNEGAIDLYLNDTRIIDDLGFQEATSFEVVVAGTGTLAIVAGADSDNSNPLATTSLDLEPNQRYFGMVYEGAEENLDISVERLMGSEQREQVHVYLAHGGLGIGPIDANILDETSEHNVMQVLAENVPPGGITFGLVENLPEFNLEIITADMTQVDVFRVAAGGSGGLGGDAGKVSAVLALSGELGGTAPLSLLQVASDGTVTLPDLVTSIGDDAGVPTRFALRGNYPNPFNPTTTIAFDLAAPGFTTLKVYNLLGQEVATLVEGVLPANTHQVTFDAATLPSGGYLYRLASGDNVQQKMLMLVK